MLKVKRSPIVQQSLPALKHTVSTLVHQFVWCLSGTNSNVTDDLVRLPKGLDPNTVYYVISAGRHTAPVPPDQTFPTEDLNTLLLAASEDDAAAGNAIYVPETSNSGVQIRMQQYIFDVNPTPFKYKVTNADPATNEFTLESAHVFDKGFRY